MFYVLSALIFIAGFILAIKTVLLIQLIIIVAGFLYLNSKYVSRMEIAVLIPIFLIFSLFGGMIFGDIFYYVSYHDGMLIKDVILWLFRP